jgi:hypothetical protein
VVSTVKAVTLKVEKRETVSAGIATLSSLLDNNIIIGFLGDIVQTVNLYIKILQIRFASLSTVDRGYFNYAI